MLPGIGVLGPSVVTELAGTGDGIEGPERAPGFCIVGFHPSTRAVLAASEANYDHSVVVKRCGGNRVAILPAFRFSGPFDASGLLIQSHQAVI